MLGAGTYGTALRVRPLALRRPAILRIWIVNGFIASPSDAFRFSTYAKLVHLRKLCDIYDYVRLLAHDIVQCTASTLLVCITTGFLAASTSLKLYSVFRAPVWQIFYARMLICFISFRLGL